MNKIASYLQSHLQGEVLDSLAVRKYFSTDTSVLEIMPSLVVYPRSTNDVRKVARFSWQLAEKGHILPITARGSGTDQAGAAIGKGVIVVFPAHLHNILELDTQQKLVRVQPGVNFQSLQETLNTHGLFLPPFPASYKYSTVGGAIANNTAGEKSLKYGAMINWVDKLEVVLANGELIQTGRLSRKEVEKKKGLPTLEGDLYRAIDGTLSESIELLHNYYDNLRVSKDSVGYNLRNVRHKDGSIDLTPLFVGSQGTLGIITEAILKVTTHSPHNTLIVAGFETIQQAIDSLEGLRALQPSSLEVIDHNLIEFAKKEQAYTFPPELVSEDSIPALVLFIEFDEATNRMRQKKVKKARRILAALTERVVVSDDPDQQEVLWALRHSAATVVNYNQGGKTSVPIIEDGVVPHEQFHAFIEEVEKLFAKNHLALAIWGHAGDANIHIQPLLDLSKTSDRQKVFRVMDEYYKMVLSLGGSIAAEHNDGRLRVPYVKLQMGEEVLEVMTKVKEGCDPRGIMNPGVKLGTGVAELVDMLRSEYSLAHLSEHLPRT